MELELKAKDRYRLLVRYINFFWFPYILAVAVIVLCSIDYYMAKRGIWPLSPTAFALGSFMTLYYFAAMSDMIQNRGSRLIALYASMKHVLFGYGTIAIISLLYGLHPSGYGEGDSMFLFAYSLFFLISVPAIVLMKSMEACFKPIVVVALLTYFGSVIVDLFQEGMFTSVVGRAAGFAVNPNTGGFTLVMLIVACVNWKEYKILDGFLWGVAAVGVFVTFSRGGIMLYSISFALYVYAVLVKNKSAHVAWSVVKMIVTTGLSGLLIVTVVIPLFGQSEQFTAYTAQKRLKSFTQMGDSQTESIGEDSRVDLFEKYVDLIAESPIIGHGAAFSEHQPLGPHNLYLLVWTDFGVSGLIALLYFIGSVFVYFIRQRDFRGYAFTVVFILEGFFAHDLLLFRPFLIVLALLCGLSYVQNSKGRTAHVQ
jgi:O-antigen ligase